MQEQAKTAYWQVCIDHWWASGGRRFESGGAHVCGGRACQDPVL